MVELGQGLAKFDQRAAGALGGTRRGVGTHFDDPNAAGLAHDAEVAPAEREQHLMRCDGRMTDERRFLARIEEPNPQVVIRGAGGAHESDLGMRKLARNGGQGRIALPIGVDHDGRRIAFEAIARECIDLKYAHSTPVSTSLARLCREFCTAPPGRLHFRRILGVVLGA